MRRLVALIFGIAGAAVARGADSPEGLVLFKLFALIALPPGRFKPCGYLETDIRLLLNGHEIDTEAILAKLEVRFFHRTWRR